MLKEKKRNCIACGYHIAYSIYHPENQPLSVLYLPKTALEAKEIPRFPMDFVACANCGHIFNAEFSYADIPYRENSNLMFNKGSGWQVFIEEQIERLNTLYGLAGKAILEIGCGDGHYLKKIKSMAPNAKCIGFEPGIEAKNASSDGMEIFSDYFMAERDLEKLKPDFIICRHVIEHLETPREFISDISYWSNEYEIFPIFLGEVPRINKSIKQARINDYLYEHVSNFTDFSFKNMFQTSGYKILNIAAGYGDEVVVIEARPNKTARLKSIKKSSRKYYDSIIGQKKTIAGTLSTLKKQNKKIAFWGATGKGAAFLNGFGINDDFPIIDSDPNKVGFFVPGTGQEIRGPEYLLENPCDVIIICTQWRAKDIYAEIRNRNIKREKVLALLNKKLVEYSGENI